MKSPQTPMTPAAMKRRLRKVENTLDMLCEDLSALAGRIPVPSREEFRRIESEEVSCPPHVLLLGLVRQVRSSLGKMSRQINDLVAYTPAEVRKYRMLRGEEELVEEICAAIQAAEGPDRSVRP